MARLLVTSPVRENVKRPVAEPPIVVVGTEATTAIDGTEGAEAAIVRVAAPAEPMVYDASGLRVITAVSGFAPVEFAFAVMANVAVAAPAAIVTDTGMSPSGSR
jgi:hypothetical protein